MASRLPGILGRLQHTVVHTGNNVGVFRMKQYYTGFISSPLNIQSWIVSHWITPPLESICLLSPFYNFFTTYLSCHDLENIYTFNTYDICRTINFPTLILCNAFLTFFLSIHKKVSSFLQHEYPVPSKDSTYHAQRLITVIFKNRKFLSIFFNPRVFKRTS